MKWNNEAKECQVCCLKFSHYSFSHLEDLHGRRLFNDHLRDAAVLRRAVGCRESQGRAGVYREQSHSRNPGKVGAYDIWCPPPLAPFKSLQPPPRTQTKEESLANSLLKQIDPKTSTADQIKEAFCRDIDAFSFEFQVK